MPLSGVLPVLATPFDADLEIDLDALRREIDWLFANGADGIVVAMVSEIQRLSIAEREHLNEAACRGAGTRGPVIVSVGAESTHLATRLARQARRSGASAVMAAPPLLLSLAEGELRRYLDAILSAAEMPLILQDSSGYVGSMIDAQLQARLVDHYGPDILMLKPEASPIGPMLTAIRTATSSDVKIFDGSGGKALVDTHARGITGTMPGPDLVWAIRAVWDALQAGDMIRAIAISEPLAMLQSASTSLDAYVALQKHLLVYQGVLSSDLVRGPVEYQLDQATRHLTGLLFDDIKRASTQTHTDRPRIHVTKPS